MNDWPDPTRLCTTRLTLDPFPTKFLLGLPRTLTPNRHSPLLSTTVSISRPGHDDTGEKKLLNRRLSRLDRTVHKDEEEGGRGLETRPPLDPKARSRLPPRLKVRFSTTRKEEVPRAPPTTLWCGPSRTRQGSSLRSGRRLREERPESEIGVCLCVS